MVRDGHPQDAGCSFADKFLGYKSYCTQCPFTEGCKLEQGMIGVSRAGKKLRDEQMREMSNQGRKPDEIAEQYGVSARTVGRALGGK